MIDPRHASPFIEPVAVEAWDAWFRWRDGAGLRDVSIEDTWQRVADALATVENARARVGWQARFARAFARWRLLPDGRILKSAGTGRITWRGGALHASLNAVAFVPAGLYPAAQLDLVALGDCAEVAVRTLDNAAVLAGVPTPRLRIGLVGVADALALLGISYNSPAGCTMAGTLARVVAAGCFRSNVALAMERGHARADTLGALGRASSRHMAADWMDDAGRHGLRHTHLTAITAQPRLALLANDVADALDPLPGENRAYTIATSAGERTVQSPGYARSVLRKNAADPNTESVLAGNATWTAQLAMRAAVQPWMDEPIAYPLLLDAAPDAAQDAAVRRQAKMHGLGTPRWRICACRPVPIRSEPRDAVHTGNAESAP